MNCAINFTTGALEQVSVRVLPDGRVTRRDAARYLGLQPKTLAMWAMYGKGPSPRKVGGRVFYDIIELQSFVKSGCSISSN